MRKLIDAEVLKEYFKQQLAETLTRLKTEEIRQLAVDITEGLMNDIDAQLPANDWETMPIDGDCISRKAVLSLLADHFDNIFDMVRELPPVAVPSANDWIPIKTRKPTEQEQKELGVDGEYNVEWMWDCVLPDDGQEVLITTRYDDVEKVSFYNEYPYGSYFEDYEDEGDVKAWMPLPESYKEEDKTALKEIVFGKKNLLPPTHRCTECKYFKPEILDSGRCKKFDDRYVDWHVYCDSWEQKEDKNEEDTSIFN